MERHWTDKDLSDARALRQLYPGAERVERLVERRGFCNTMIWYKDGRKIGFRIDVIPSLNPGESVLLDDVLNERGANTVKEDAMETNTKPRICEVLGVEVGEEWAVEGTEYDTIYRISMSGNLQYLGGDGCWHLPNCGSHACDLVAAIAYSETILHNRHWSAEDIADAKAVKRIWPDTTKVQRLVDTSIRIETPIVRVLPSSMFPTLKAGEFCNLGSILEAEGEHE